MSNTKRYPGVIVKDTERGKSFALRYTDATGARPFVFLGYADQGWTAKKASDELRRRKVAAENGHFEPAGKVTFDTFAPEWLARIESKGLKRSTVSGYRTIVERHLAPAFGHLRMDKATMEDVERFVTSKLREGAKPRTVNAYLQCLGAIFKDALKRRVVSSNPVDLVDRQKQRTTAWKILSPEEFGSVVRAFDAMDDSRAQTASAMFQVMMETGMRRGELLGLKWSSVHLADPDSPRIRIESTWTRNAVDTPKSASSNRTLTISDRLAGVLMDLRAATPFAGDDDWTFPSPTGQRPFDIHTFADLLREACRTAGIEDSMRPFHDLRHSSLTNGALAGMSPASLQARAGHSSYQVTQRYVALAGRTFEDEQAKLEERLYGTKVAV